VLARVTGRPVRYVMTRREELEAGMPAPQVIIRLKTGVKRDGTLVALDGEVVIESGAFSGAVLAVSGVFLASLLQVAGLRRAGLRGPHAQAVDRGVSRARGAHTIFAIDSQMEQIARAIGQDPVAFRCATWSARAIRLANGQPWLNNGGAEVLTRIAEHPIWKSRNDWKASARDGACAAPVWRSAGGWAACNRPAPPCASTRRLAECAHGPGGHRGNNIALAQIAGPRTAWTSST